MIERLKSYGVQLEKKEKVPMRFYPMFWKEKLSYSPEKIVIIHQRICRRNGRKSMAEKIFLRFQKPQFFLVVGEKAGSKLKKSSGYRNN